MATARSNGRATATVRRVAGVRHARTLMVRLVAGLEGDPAGRLRRALPARRAARDLPGRRLRDALRRRARGGARPDRGRARRAARALRPRPRPRDMLELLAAWLGVELDESQDARTQREIVRRAAELGRRRGTGRGLELALALHFPDCRCASRTAAACAGRRRRRRGRTAPPASFVVYCDTPIPEDTPGGDRPLHRAATSRCTRTIACA